jgi:hypothetical protein
MGCPPPNGTNRVGRHQRAVLRALLGYNMVMTTRELFPFVWPRLDPDQSWPEWKWLKVRRAAEKFAFRLGPRARPLRWKLKPEVLVRYRAGRNSS